MGKIQVDLSGELDESANNSPPAKFTEGLPSVSRAKTDVLKYADRVQFSFTNVPKPIKEQFAALAREKGITQKELLYHCLRAGGLSIPRPSEIDGRRR